MGRIRTVKPDLFTHEDLFEAEKESGLPLRVAFIGLFTCADREGRFKWRPRTLKLAVLPHDEVDFSRVLDALVTRGFLVKYASATGEEIGLIPTFTKHQVINNRECASDLPPPPADLDLTRLPTRAPTRDPRVTDACPTPAQGKGREGKGKEEEGKGNTLLSLSLVEPIAEKPDDVKTIFEFWQKRMDSPRSVLDANRRGLIERALKNYSPADVCKAISGCSKSPHHMGKNDRNTAYNGLDLILRNSEKIESFIRMDANPPAAQGSGQANGVLAHNDAVMAAFLASDASAAGDPMTIDMEH
jgi:hypothetical protein